MDTPHPADDSEPNAERARGRAWYTRSVLSRLANPFELSDDPGDPAATTPDIEHDPESGDARYAVVDELGRGGVGVVFKARDHDLRRDVAMKVLQRQGGTTGTIASVDDLDPAYLGRFLEEAQVTGQLDHPGIVPIHELGLDREGQLFFTMRMVRGQTFGDVLEHVVKGSEGWTTTRALGVILKVCEAMGYAHHKGVVHRDIKPANIMVGRFGESYVMDWGLAKLLDAATDGGGTTLAAVSASLNTRSLVQSDRQEATDSDRDSPHATLQGDVVGTPAYMAPEQAGGEHQIVGKRSDVYSVGALLYQLLTGQPPYVPPGTKVSPHMVLRWVVEGPPKPVTELAPKAPPELAAICDKAMARDPSARYDGMLAMAEDIQAFIEDRVVRAHQSGAWAEFRKWVRRNRAMAGSIFAALVVAMASLGIVGWVQTQSKRDLADKNSELGGANAALADSNSALEAARNVAVENEQRALSSEREARLQGYVANITAAAAALDDGAAAAARRYLDACDPTQRGWEWRHLSLRADSSVSVLGEHDSLVWSVAFSPDGTRVAAASGPFFAFGGDQSAVTVWDAESSERLATLAHEQAVLAVDFHPNGHRLLSGSADGSMREWDVDRREQLGVPLYVGGYVTAVQYSPDGERVAACSNDDDDIGHVFVRDTRRFETVIETELDAPCTTLDVSPDGKLLAVGLSDFSVRLWDLTSTQPDAAPTATLLGPNSEVAGLDALVETGVTSVHFSPDGKRLAAAMSDLTVALWDVETQALQRSIPIPRGTPVVVRFSPDGNRLLVGDLSGALQFFDPARGDALEVLNGHNQFVYGLAFRSDGGRIASGSWDRTVRLWDGRPGSALTISQGRNGGGPTVAKVTFSPDGRYVAWCPSLLSLHMTDAWTGEMLYTATEVISAVGAMAFSPDGSRLYVQSEMEGVSVLDARTGAIEEQLVGPLPYSERSAFDPGCRYLAHVADARREQVDLYRLDTGDLMHQLVGHEDAISTPAFSADGTRLVTPSFDGTLRVWNVETGACDRVIETGGQPFRVMLTPDGRHAITSDFDIAFTGLRTWDLQTGELLDHAPSRSIFLNCTMSADASRVLSAHADGTVGVWAPGRGQLVSIPASGVPMVQVAIDEREQRVASLDRGGRLWIWETVPPGERATAREQAARRGRWTTEARRVVADARAEHMFTAEIITALQTDRSLSTELRDAAVRLARADGDSRQAIRAQLLDVVLEPGHSPAEYLAAFDRAALAESRWRDVHQPLLAGGAALYRLGQPSQALPVIREAGFSGYTFAFVDMMYTKTLEAMCLHATGATEEARVLLNESHTRCAQNRNRWDPEEVVRAERIIAEAERLLAGDP